MLICPLINNLQVIYVCGIHVCQINSLLAQKEKCLVAHNRRNYIRIIKLDNTKENAKQLKTVGTKDDTASN